MHANRSTTASRDTNSKLRFSSVCCQSWLAQSRSKEKETWFLLEETEGVFDCFEREKRERKKRGGEGGRERERGREEKLGGVEIKDQMSKQETCGGHKH